ncbi:MAG TPA: hypothetical protein PLX41_09435 [Bacteroidales bacterium]|nr:hypothetical protein [Bacteroidales bacterium]
MSKQAGLLALDSFALNCSIVKGDTVIPVSLKRLAETWELTLSVADNGVIPIHLDILESVIPGLSLPSGIGSSGIDIREICLRLTDEMSLIEFYVVMDIKGFASIATFGLLNETIPVKIIYEENSGNPRYGIQLLEWPFNLGFMHYLDAPYSGWILIDFDEFGSIMMELPKFFAEGNNFVINGEVKFTRSSDLFTLKDGSTVRGKGLNIPVKFLCSKTGLSVLTPILPRSVPVTPENTLGDLIRQAGGNPDNLPYDFMDYLDISAPDGIQYDVVISSTGDLSVRLSLPDSVTGEDTPVKILVPSLPFLMGVKIYNIGFSSILGNPMLNIDVETDQFLLPILVALSWFNADELDFITDLRRVNFHLNAKDVWILLSTIIPVPVFYDDISFRYCGVEGFAIESGIKLPRPGLNVADFGKIGAFLVQIMKFITHGDYYLEPQDLGSADLKFTLGPTYAEFPKYVGSPLLGTKDNVFTMSAAEILCHILNTMKNPSMTRFITMIPEDIRYLNAGIDLGPLHAALKTGFTTVEEFKEDTVSGYPSNILERLFTDVDRGLLTLVYGRWDIAPLVDFEVMLGVSLRDFRGGALHVGLHGDIGENFIACEITGVTVLNLDNRHNPFIFDLRSKLVLLGQNIGTLATRLDSNGFMMAGSSTLIDWGGFRASAELRGALDRRGGFLLSGAAQVKMAGIDLLDSFAEVHNNSIAIKSMWLGFSLNFYSKISGGGLIIIGSGAVPEIALDKKLPSFTIHTPAGSYTVGSLHVKCGLSAGVNITITGTSFDASVNVSFTFIKSFTFTFALSDIPDTFDKLKDLIIDEVIKKIIDSLLSIPDGWEHILRLIKDGLAFVEDVAGMLVNGFGKSIDFAAQAMKEILEYSAEQIGEALKKMGATAAEVARALYTALGMAGHAISEVLMAAAFTPVEAAQALKDALNYSSEQMVENMLKAGAEVRDIAVALGKVFNKTIDEVAEFLRGMGKTLEEITGILASGLGFAAREIAKALQSIGGSVAEISEALVNALGCGADLLAGALDSIGATASEIAGVLSNLLGSGAAEIAAALKSVGKTAAEIASAVSGVLSTTAEAMSAILKNIGFSASDIAGSLKDVYGLSGDAAAAILKGIGVGAGDIAKALSDVFSFGADRITSILKNLSFPVSDIAGALFNALALPAVRVADLLKGIGASAAAIADFFKGVNIPNIGNILEQVGFAGDVIQGVVDIVGCPVNSFCMKCPKCDLCAKCPKCWKCPKY